MPEKPTDPREELRALMSALAEAFVEASDDDVLAETREKGLDPDQAAEEVQDVFRQAVKSYRQRPLREAQRQYQERVSQMRGKRYNLPATSGDCRKLFDTILAARPELRPAFLTAQHRDFRELTDADIESCLRQLLDLGVFPAPLDVEDEKQ